MLTLVIPTCKEAKNIDILLTNIDKGIVAKIPQLQVILIDDDSQDGIEEVVERHNRKGKIKILLKVRHSNKGLASAWKEGIKDADTPLVGIMDADLAHDPQDMLRLVENLADADMIIGSRYLPQHIVRMEGKSFLETRLSIWAQYLTRFLLKIQVCDISHSLRVFRREVFTKVEPFLECRGNAMMIEFTFYTVRYGFKIKEIPVSYGKRLHGETKLGILKEGTRLLKVLRKLRKHFSTKGKTPS